MKASNIPKTEGTPFAPPPLGRLGEVFFNDLMRGSLWGQGGFPRACLRTLFDDTKNQDAHGREGDKEQMIKTQKLRCGNCCSPGYI